MLPPTVTFISLLSAETLLGAVGVLLTSMYLQCKGIHSIAKSPKELK